MGSKLCLISDRDSKSDIYVMSADGSHVTKLTDDLADYRSPVWSPDGKTIAFVADLYRDSKSDVYMMNSDGSGGITKLTNEPAYAGLERISWSPDGKKIAFTVSGTSRPNSEEIYIVNTSGNVTKFINDPVSDNFDPAWSPDGKQIAFVSNRDGNGEQIYVMNADGIDLIRLTHDQARDGFPSWSPDGKHIVFVSYGSGIYVMNADGSGVTEITRNEGDYSPSWSSQ